MSQVLTNASEFSVTEIAHAVKRSVEDQFGHVRVRGEISGFRGQHSSGHAYFTLKDEGATIDAVIWKGSFSKLSFKPQEGLEIIATGRLTTFPRSSKYQIVIENIEPAGAGALMALLEERRKKLLAEGLFARERKRPLPYLPRVIGVITSPTGAVIRDILHRLDDRFPSHVLVWPVRVQGETCAPEVVNAIEGFNALTPGGTIPRPDLLIVARGGGSIEDLWGFNEEAVVRAVAGSDIPVITAVGHETDTTLVDYASDMRAPTPTAAAEASVPVRAELIAYVDDQGNRQRQAARRQLLSLKDRLRAASAGLPRANDLVSNQRQSLDLASSQLAGALRHFVQSRRMGFANTSAPLQPRLIRQRHAELGDRIKNLSRYAEAGLVKSVEKARLTFDPKAQRLPDTIKTAFERKHTALARISPRLSAQPLKIELTQAQGMLTQLDKRLAMSAGQATLARRQQVEQLTKLLNSLSYRNVLARGYALVQDETGQIVTSKSGAKPGDSLKLTFVDGDLAATVAGAPAIKRKPSRNPDGGGQESLF